MDGTKQYPPPGYTQVPTEPPPGNCPYPVQSGSSPMHQQYAQQPMYPQLDQHQQPPGNVYYTPIPTGQAVIITQPQYGMGQPVIIQAQPQPKRYVGTIVLAVFVLLCCGFFVGMITLALAVAAQLSARKHPNTARCLGRTSIAIAVIWTALIVLIVVLYFGAFIGFSTKFSDVFPSAANNETLSAEDQDLLEAMGEFHYELQCREVSDLSVYEKARVSDSRTLALIRKCDAMRPSTRRSTTPLY